MRQALTILYSRVVIEALIILAVVGLIAARLRRRLRVSPRQRTHAPVLWIVNFTADARLHRRLRQLAERARSASVASERHRRRYGQTAAQRLATDLEAEVITLDERLVESRKEDFDTQHTIVEDIRADADRIDGLIERVLTLIEAEAADPVMALGGDPVGAIAARVAELESIVRSESATLIEVSVDHTETSGPAELDSPR